MDREADKLEQLIKKHLKGIPKDAVLALSGGIDSALLATLLKPKVVTVEVPFGEDYDELDNAKKIATYLKLNHSVVTFNILDFDEVMVKAVKIIGKPIPHFNIYPLYKMYERLSKEGFKNVVLGDGPDESMCGYTRHLIMDYLYDSYEAFDRYGPTIDKVLPPPAITYKRILSDPNIDQLSISSIFEEYEIIKAMCLVDMELMRPSMNTMSDKLAEHFGIKNWRPYEIGAVDDFMFNLPDEMKIGKNYNQTDPSLYGKWLLRVVTSNYFTMDIAWRKHKMGGPLVPVNQIKGWFNTDGKYGKKSYLRWQKEILA